MEETNKLLEIENLHVHFPITQGIVIQRKINELKAVDGISFDVFRGETVGLAGESGCGKSTTARAIMRLIAATSGKIVFAGDDISNLSQKELLPYRKRMQMIFQDPYASLNPRMSIVDIISDPLIEHSLIDKKEKVDAVENLMKLVGLNPLFMNRYPHEFSGGQRQRIGIARALALKPEFVVCDEPVSALDVSVQAQIINLMQDLQEELKLSYLIISHDLSVLKHTCDRLVIMYLGKIVEMGKTAEIFDNPCHPYTQALLSAVPKPDPAEEKKKQRIILQGEIPSPINKPKGCPFSPRCSRACKECFEIEPTMKQISDSHFSMCYF